jgi:hypothetical protein
MYLGARAKIIVACHSAAEGCQSEGDSIVLMRINVIPDLQGALTAD